MSRRSSRRSLANASRFARIFLIEPAERLAEDVGYDFAVKFSLAENRGADDALDLVDVDAPALCREFRLRRRALLLPRSPRAIVRQCRAELMATQSWLRDEVAELRRERAAARAELHRLRAIDTKRDPDATLN